MTMLADCSSQCHFIGPISEDLMMKIIGFLDLPCRYRLQLNREFRRVVGHVFDCATEIDGREMRGRAGFISLVPRCPVLQEFYVPGCDWMDDTLLHELSENCSQLRRLDVSSCPNITDRGISELAQHCRGLRFVDLTFCTDTTYASVLALRDSCPDIIVRRQPEWLDGHFECPWTPPEIHTYYCDGSFQFSRDEQATGWVCSLVNRGEFLCDRLQYVDQSEYGQYLYRRYSPGVLLKRSPDGGSVYVAQALYGMHAPETFPAPPEDMAVGSCVTLNTDDGQVMLSQMRVRPLAGRSAREMMPPAALVEKIRRFLQDEARFRADGDDDSEHGPTD